MPSLGVVSDRVQSGKKVQIPHHCDPNRRRTHWAKWGKREEGGWSISLAGGGRAGGGGGESLTRSGLIILPCSSSVARAHTKNGGRERGRGSGDLDRLVIVRW